MRLGLTFRTPYLYSAGPYSPPMLKQRFSFLLPILVLTMLSGIAPAAASTHPLQTGVAAATPSAPNREVFGFALASSLSDSTVGYPSWNFSLLSTVAFFGVHVQDDGTFASDSGATVWNSSQLTSLVSTAHSHSTKVVLTIIMQDFSAGTPHMCAALSHGSTTVANTVAEVKAKGVDGVNVDYEGLNGSCGQSDQSWARNNFTSFVASLRTAMPSGSYISVDTYGSSASDPIGFYDIPGLAPNTDSFFVMDYDLEYSNYSHSPLNCSSFCLGPTAPLGSYYYNDTTIAQQYVAAAPASKMILGVPYYGRKSCVPNGSPNQYPTGGVVADTYLDAIGESTAPETLAGSYGIHRDANDPAGEERWDTWYNTTLKCTRELYWDDTISLGHKYDLVNADNLRGVGIWNLNYGGGASELWNLLAAKFTTTSAWKSVGGILTSSPGYSSWGASRVDVFVRATDNSLYQNTWNGTAWTGWSPLGGLLTSSPAAVSWAANRIDVFVRGSDNQLYHRFFDGTRWSGWEALGGVLTSGPGVASWASGRLDVFVRGSDNALYHKWWDGKSWSMWQSLGGILTSDPTAVAWGPNRIDVFVRGTDNGVWQKYWNGQSWSSWTSYGGMLSYGPSVSSCASGHLDVWATGSDHALYQLGYNGAWGSWQRLGGYWTSDPGAVCPTGATTVSVFERGTDNALWQTSLTGS